MKRLFIILFAIFVAVEITSAKKDYERVRIGDLYYNLCAKTKTAEVTYKSCNNHSSYNQGWDITTVNIPSTITFKKNHYAVTSIGNHAFANCGNLNSIQLPSSITCIGDYAFWGSGLIAITLPLGLDSIGAYAFYHCSSLTSIELPTPLKFIGSNAFEGCSGILTITIPTNVKKILSHAFYACDNLLTVRINSDYIVSSGDFTYDSNFRKIFGEQVTSYILGDNITAIGKFAFAGCNMKQMSIPNRVSKINDYAFFSCSKLESVNLPEGLKVIGGFSFCNSENLQSVYIPNSVTEIADGAFSGCKSLSRVLIGTGVTKIGSQAFLWCDNIKDFLYPENLNLTSASLPSSIKTVSYKRDESPRPRDEYPPMLCLVENSLSFTDASMNNIIEAAERCAIRFKILNRGKGAAHNCKAIIKMTGTSKGISLGSVKLPSIGAGQTTEAVIPISSSIDTQDGNVTFTIEVYEPSGWGVAPFDMTVATKAYEQPLLQVVDYQIASTSGRVRKMEPFTLAFNLQNTKYGDAEMVNVKINLPNNVFMMDGLSEYSYALIKSGEVRPIKVILAANNNYTLTDIPISIEVSERYGKFAENRQLNIALNQTTTNSINIAAKDEPKKEREEIQLALMTSDVDRNIPQTKVKNPNTFVLIIANENYQSLGSNVPYALNDGNSFKLYCEQTLGVEPKKIHFISNATGNQIKTEINNWLKNVLSVFDNANAIFYYAGHGMPDETNRASYLLPVDGSTKDLSTCYKLDDLYTMLGELNAGRVAVFIDACFSGSNRGEGMLASARGVALKARPGMPQGNMVVFSAAQGDETAYPYSEQKHGLFTYFLLKKLQETEGNVTLQELGDYIVSNVKQQSVLENGGKVQTPSITPAALVSDVWQSWKLR